MTKRLMTRDEMLAATVAHFKEHPEFLDPAPIAVTVDWRKPDAVEDVYLGDLHCRRCGGVLTEENLHFHRFCTEQLVADLKGPAK